MNIGAQKFEGTLHRGHIKIAQHAERMRQLSQRTQTRRTLEIHQNQAEALGRVTQGGAEHQRTQKLRLTGTGRAAEQPVWTVLRQTNIQRATRRNTQVAANIGGVTLSRPALQNGLHRHVIGTVLLLCALPLKRREQMSRLVHLRLVERALLLFVSGAVEVLKSGAERFNAQPVSVLAQTLTRQRVHLIDTLGGLHRRRRITVRAVADALPVATLARTLNPGRTKKRTGGIGRILALGTAQHAERRGAHLLLTRGGERAGLRRLRNRPGSQRGQQGSVNRARMLRHKNQRWNRCGQLRLQATL